MLPRPRPLGLETDALTIRPHVPIRYETAISDKFTNETQFGGGYFQKGKQRSILAEGI